MHQAGGAESSIERITGNGDGCPQANSVCLCLCMKRFRPAAVPFARLSVLVIPGKGA